MLTLIEAAKRAAADGNIQKAAVIETYARSSDILRVIPFESINGNSISYSQEHSLPGIGFRGVNESYTESTGVINPVTERLVIAGGDLDVDRYIVTTMGVSHRTSQEMMKVKALAHRWSHAFIKGDSTGTSKEFDGLQARLTGSQLIAAGASSGGDALALAKIDELIDAVDDPMGLLMSKAMRRRLTSAARSASISGTINFTMDEFGRQVTTYNDLPILIADANGSPYQTLAFNEANPGGGSNVGTSIYCLSWGDMKLTGLQNQEVDVEDLGELQSKPTYRTRVEWYTSIAAYHPRCAARLYGIKDAAVTV